MSYWDGDWLKNWKEALNGANHKHKGLDGEPSFCWVCMNLSGRLSCIRVGPYVCILNTCTQMPSWKSIPSAIFLLKHVLEVFPYQRTGEARSLVAALSSTSFSRVLCVVNQFPVNVLGWGWFPVHLWVWELGRHFLCPFLCSPLPPPVLATWLYLGRSLANSGVLPALVLPSGL